MTNLFTEHHHPPGALQGLIGDLIGFELEPLQVRQRPFGVVSGGHDDHSKAPSRLMLLNAENVRDLSSRTNLKSYTYNN